MRRHSSILITLVCTCILTLALQAEMHRFKSADGSKDFIGELTGYDPKTKKVSVKINRRVQSFNLELLSEEDQKYVIEHGESLALANDIDISLDSFTDKYVKKKEKRIEDRIYPSGYEVKLSNRSRRTFEDIKLSYTIYYGVQDYLKPERKTEESSGELVCKTLTSLGSTTLRTETVSIVTGELEPVIKNEVMRNPDGSTYIEPIVVQPGGRRKDQLIGCTVNLLIDGKIVKTVTEGKIQLEQKKRDF